MSGWIGVDLDGTLARYEGWVGPTHIGEPVPAMVARVKQWLAEGKEVRIFTARAWPLADVIGPDDEVEPAGRHNRLQEALRSVFAIRLWCAQHIGVVLPVTCVKDYGMVALYDDRCVQVKPNTGELVQ